MTPKLVLPPNFVPIDTGRVEDALAARWQTPDHDAGPAVHACTLNLIACVEDAAATAAVSAIVDQLAATHPIRAVTIVTDEAAEANRIQAWVAAGSAAAPGSQISSEEITLFAQPDDTELLAATVEGMLAADLPAYFWWRGGSPTRDHTFSALARLANKIVVDSIRFGDGAAALDTVRRLLDYRDGRAGVADLNWVRTAPWREAVAACFDDPEALALLPLFDRASINYASGPEGALPPSARALLISGWLASRLNRLRGRVRLKPVVEAGHGPGRVLKVSLSSRASPAALELERRPAPTGVVAVAKDQSGRTIREWLFPTTTLSEAELLHRSIDSPARDPLLEAALHHD